jgi:glycerophosphoryl diester phosphodiesterase
MHSPVLMLGHRGARASGSVPENTLGSFELALEHGCDGFEFDLRLTACGRLLVSHDDKVGSITVSRATSRQLTNLPRFEEVLARYRTRGFLDIELKVPGLEQKVLTALRDMPPERNYVVSSFLPEVLLELKARKETIPVGIICEKPNQLIGWPKLPVDYVIVKQSLVNRKLVQLVHQSRRKLLAWTVNDKQSMLQFAGWGIDGIISDDTQLLVETLADGRRPPSQQVRPSWYRKIH